MNDIGCEDCDDEAAGCGCGGCYYCGGSGWIVVCIDDLCRGAGECMHGDGEEPCPVCNSDLSKDPC